MTEESTGMASLGLTTVYSTKHWAVSVISKDYPSDKYDWLRSQRMASFGLTTVLTSTRSLNLSSYFRDFDKTCFRLIYLISTLAKCLRAWGCKFNLLSVSKWWCMDSLRERKQLNRYYCFTFTQAVLSTMYLIS